MMAAPLLTFLATLFKVPKHKLFRNSIKDLDELIQPLDDEDDDPEEEHFPMQQKLPQDDQLSEQRRSSREQHDIWERDHKSTQLHCLFQMLMYNIHNGVKKLLLHMMLGHAL